MSLMYRIGDICRVISNCDGNTPSCAGHLVKIKGLKSEAPPAIRLTIRHLEKNSCKNKDAECNFPISPNSHLILSLTKRNLKNV